MKDAWIQTYTRKRFYILDPRPEDVCIEDIAHALSLLCRFNGQIKCFYSVAQHSVTVASNVPPEHRRWALLHDASEAYVGDMTSPLKAEMPEFRLIEARIQAAIGLAFGLVGAMPPTIKAVDRAALEQERLQLFTGPPMQWMDAPPPLPFRIQPMDPKKAEESFMKAWRKYAKA